MLEVEHLKVRYANGALGVTDSSLRIAQGQIVVLFGANGAGKTTTLRAIGGFMASERAQVVGGRVVFDGSDITNARPETTARLGIATVVERRKIFANLSVLDNLLALGPHQLGRDWKSKMERVFDLFPVLQKRLSQPAGRLSGGQQQMLALSRAIMARPRLLLIDEVTLGLHPSVHPVLYGAIRTIADEGTSVLVVDESAASALEVVDYCYLISGGQLVDEGGPGKFKSTDLLAMGYL